MLCKMIYVYSLYNFLSIKDLNYIKHNLLLELNNLNVKGTILISREGINVNISQSREILDKAIEIIKRFVCLNNTFINKSKSNEIAFQKLKVKIKDEIIKFNYKNFKKTKDVETVNPKKWNSLLDKNVQIIDMRNSFEYSLGTFKNSINLKMKNFTDLKNKSNELDKLDKDKPTAIFCTGGIRCEKAGSFLNDYGFSNVYQLEGGIINYLNTEKDNDHWEGDCFVFDDRILIRD